MSKPFPLLKIQELMQEREEEAKEWLAKLIAAEQDAKNKLQMLEEYRLEYAERFNVAAQNGMTQMAWQNFQNFLDKIDDAIRSQRKNVAQFERNTAQGQQKWQEARRKVKAFDTLSDRHLARENAKEARQAQKEQDEFVARKTFDQLMQEEEKVKIGAAF